MPVDPQASAGAVFQAIPLDPATGQPDGKAIYDALMQGIEPELLSTSLPTLKETYKNETPDQAKARGERYAAAFQKYDAAYAAYVKRLQDGTHQFRRDALASTEADSRSGEAANLSSLDSAISAL